MEGQLLVGTLKLETTDLAVSSDQASQLLPLWETLQSLATSGTAATEEVQAVVDQIKSTMSTSQISSITAMNLTQQDLATAMSDNGASSSSSNPASTTSGNSAQLPAGGPAGAPAGGNPGGVASGRHGQRNGRFSRHRFFRHASGSFHAGGHRSIFRSLEPDPSLFDQCSG